MTSNAFLDEIDEMLANEPKREVDETMLVSSLQRFTEPCPKCGGTGMWHGVRRCFACKGVGSRTYRQSAAARAKARERSAEKRASKVAENEADWRAREPDIAAWIDGNPTFGFALSMLEAVRKFGDLTEGQRAACHRCMARDHARREEEQRRKAEAPQTDATAVVAALHKARASGLRRPRLRADSFDFSLAPAHGSNPGAVYVKEKRDYIGKILDGKFYARRGVESETVQRLLQTLENPEAAAVRYGRMTGQCGCCGRELTNKESVARGIGPICAERFGW